MIRQMLAKRLGVRLGNEDGVAMIMVIGVAMVLTLLAVGGVAYATGSMKKARNDQDWNGALSAAYAGVEEYLSRLANDPAYLSFGNPGSPYSSAAGATVVLPETKGAAVNPAFSLTGWATVPGSDGTASFRYEVDNTDYYSTGTLHLRATGRVGQEVRTVVADLRQKGFIDFLYFTDFETQDPLVTAKTIDSETKCAKYEYQGRSTDCTIIRFGGFDKIDGPLHSNDTLQICDDPEFLGPTTSTYTPPVGQLRYKRPGGCSATPYFKVNVNQPGWQGTMPMPDTNTELKRETRSDLPAEVPNPGCLYTGPTSIEFLADGTMKVRSPWTKKTSPNGVNNVGCGTPGAGGLASAGGQIVTVPLNTVVYVQNVPTTAGDPNRWATGESGKPTCPSGGNPLGYPLTNENVRYPDAYGCQNGDVFTKGTLDGHVTVAAENYVYVTGNLVYEDVDEDILGLVGQNAVWVWNPYKSVTGTSACTSYTPDQSGYASCQWSGTAQNGGSNRRIDAAILSVAHTFMVQNYDVKPARGNLTVYGAIAQKYRGTVATSSGASIVSGYGKDYQYDPRFKKVSPPKFLSPAVVTYGVTTWVEVQRAFKPDGTPA